MNAQHALSRHRTRQFQLDDVPTAPSTRDPPSFMLRFRNQQRPKRRRMLEKPNDEDNADSADVTASADSGHAENSERPTCRGCMFGKHFSSGMKVFHHMAPRKSPPFPHLICAGLQSWHLPAVAETDVELDIMGKYECNVVRRGNVRRNILRLESTSRRDGCPI